MSSVGLRGCTVALLATTALTSPLSSDRVSAQSLPTGGSVAAGGVAIAQPSATQLNITQSSQSAVVNWQSFSVGQGSAVNIAQPNASSALLNRVTSDARSTIAGQINANGQVYLVNPNGIAITKSGTVNTSGGFVASSLGISDSDFMAGKRTFTGNGSSASVRNAGTISVGRGGYAALIGGTISNSGTIDVPLGKAGLSSGERATLDFSGDGFLQVGVPTDSKSKGALMRNSGTIRADGGSVMISAATAREAARNAIKIPGTIQARSIGGRSGSIVIGGGAGGSVRITGRLIATSRQSAGGRIQITGRDIRLKGATIDASGKTGGGTINIGGGYQGRGPLQRADTTKIDQTTTIKADATETGNGGNVVVWSDLLTNFAGTISAKGSAASGKGGEAEVSGKAQLAYTGFTDLTSAHGAFGTLLLDPYNITISTGATTSSNFAVPTGTSNINNGALQTALSAANVTISTGASGSPGSDSGNITVIAPVTWSSGSMLTLTAANAIAVKANILVAGSGSVALNPGTTTVRGLAQPLLSFAQGASVSFTNANGGPVVGSPSGSLSINGNAFSLIYTMGDLAALNNQTGRFALANNLVASNTYTAAVVGSFPGTLEGLGHTVSNVTVSDLNNGRNIGLIGTLTDSGTVRDLAIIDSNMAGLNTVGGLIGSNNGTVIQVTASGAVFGFSDIGGLVGSNAGTVMQAYAISSVSGSLNIGGLAGTNTGTITSANAGGVVSGPLGSGQYLGGLVGTNTGLISQTYATGVITGNTEVGGLVGTNSGILIKNYWDTQTSGRTNAFGADSNAQSGNVTGLTTAQMQSGSASGLGSNFGGGVNGLYPYLASFFPTGVQAVSGLAYKDAGITPLVSNATEAGQVSVIANGKAFGSVSTGANGYYYAFAPTGSIAAGQSLLAYTQADVATGATNATTLASGSSNAAQAGLNIYGNTLGFATAVVALSNAPSLVGLQSAATNAAGTNGAAAGVVAATTGRGYVATGPSFSIDVPTTVAAGSSLLVFTAPGNPLTVDAAVTVASTGSLGLFSGGALAINANVTARGAASVGLGAGVTTVGASTQPLLSFAQGASVSFTNANGDPVVFSPSGSLSINGNAYSLVYTMGDLAALDYQTGRYALANDLVASNIYTASVISRFDGTLEGLGHSIGNVTVSNTNNGQYIGLIGTMLTGTVRDLAMIGGNMAGSLGVGGLIGLNGGTVMQVTASGSVSGSSGIGGLVGTNFGTITQAYVTASISGGQDVGGLVGSNTSTGTITLANASGFVAGSQNVGGLVGNNAGTIAQTYATAVVNATSQAGGLVGTNSGTVTQSYWDTRTSGQPTGSIGTGLTTAQLQSGSASGLGSSFGGGATGLYPYLASFFPNGVQAVSGLAYKDAGTTLLASNATGVGQVSVIGNGTTFATVSTGANGYYYAFGPAGSIAAGQSILAYTQANATTGATNAATYVPATIASSNANVNVYGGWRLDRPASSVTSLTALDAAFTAATGSSAAASLTFANREIRTSGSTFDFNSNVSVTGTLSVSSSATVTQKAGAIGASALLLAGSGSFTLTRDGNTVATVSADVASVDFANTGALMVGSISSANGTAQAGVVARTGPLSVSTSGNLTLASGALVRGANPVLAAGAAFINNAGSGAVSATQNRWLIYSASPTDDTFGSLDSRNAAIWNATPIKLPPGNVTQSGNRYLFANQPKLTLTSTDLAKTYGDDVTSALGTRFTVSGYATGVSGAFLGDNAATAFSGAPLVTSGGAASTAGVVGSPYAITIAQGSLVTSGYALAFNNTGRLTVSQRALTVTADAQSRAYGDGNPALTYTVGGSGLVNGDALTVALTTTATTASNVGAYAISQTVLTASPNYALNYVGANLSVTPRALTVTADAQGRIYGDANPALTYTVGGGGLVNGDALTVALTTNATIASNVGAYAITQTALTASSNYAVSYVGSNLTVIPRAVAVTADAQSRIYGDGNPSLTYTASGFINGDGLTGSLATAATTTSSVGAYAITQGSLAASPNYAVNYTGANLSVTPRGLTVMADARGRIYGDANPALTYMASGLIDGDGLTGALATAATATSNVGAYAITQGTLGSPNYTLNYTSANLTVTPASVAVTALGGTSVYGSSPVNPGLSASGLKNGEGATVLTGLSNSFGITSTTGVAGNPYTVSVTGTLTNPNYSVGATTNGTWSVTPRALVVAADAQSRAYGDGNPALTYTVVGGGLVNSDALTVALTTNATTASNVGAYAITQTALNASPNYAVSYVGANLTVTPRAVVVTADAQSRIYGDGNPSLTYLASGFINGDGLTGSLATTATATFGVGAYAITQGSLVASPNYAVNYTGASLSVTPRGVTVTADAQSRIYGDGNPTLTYTASGFINGDSFAGSLATAATATSNVGAYAITQGTLGSPNYALNYTGANLSVTPASVAVTALGGTSVYGSSAVNPGLSVGGLKNGENATVLTGLSNSFGITPATGVAGSPYTLSVLGTLTNPNYSVSATINGTWSVTPRALTVTADAQSRAYGDGNPALTYTVGGGLVSGDGLSGALTTNATTASNVGAYAIGQGSLAASSNYTLSYTGANLTVTPRGVTVTADAQSRSYGDANPALTYNVSGGGLVNGDALTVALTTSATTASNVGAYAIAQTALTALPIMR